MYYIDSNVFIYTALDNTEVGNNARKIMKYIMEKKLKCAISPLVMDEVMWSVQRMVGREVSIRVSNLILSLPLIWFDVSYDTVQRVLEFYRKGLDPRDAFHIAVMLEYGVSSIISEDRDFDKISEIKRLSIKEIAESI